jgi:hypothetical protein
MGIFHHRETSFSSLNLYDWAITKMKNTSFQVLLCSETPEINVVPITKSLHPQKVLNEEEEDDN